MRCSLEIGCNKIAVYYWMGFIAFAANQVNRCVHRRHQTFYLHECINGSADIFYTN